MRKPHVETARERFILWLWKRLPINGRARLLITWLFNLRYAVGVAAVITNEAGEVLLVRHTYRGGRYDWGLPGGWAKGRESMERAIQRELYEETSLELSIDGLAAVHSGFALPRLTVVFKGHITGGTFQPSAEVSECAYYSPDRLGHILPGERWAVRRTLNTTESGFPGGNRTQ